MSAWKSRSKLWNVGQTAVAALAASTFLVWFISTPLCFLRHNQLAYHGSEHYWILQNGSICWHPNSNLYQDRGWRFKTRSLRLNSLGIARLGFRLPNAASDGSWVDFPLWIPWLFFTMCLFLPCLFKQRTKSYRCNKCKYDLTGNVSGICPECGTSVPKEKRKTVCQALQQ